MSQASWKDQIKKKWGPHSHCPICGKAMPTDKQFFGMMAVLFVFMFVFGGI
jgi:hypothetical protein